MNKFLRWVGYASTLVGAILLIWACFGAACHSNCSTSHNSKAACVCKHQPAMASSTMKDSASCKKQQGCNSKTAKNDSAMCKSHHKCCGAQKDNAACGNQSQVCMNGGNNSMCWQKPHQPNLLSFSFGFFLLAISLFMISKNCCCCCNDKCCESKESDKTA
jgi:hypothetical protein